MGKIFGNYSACIYKKPVVAYFSDFDCLNEVSSQSQKNE